MPPAGAGRDSNVVLVLAGRAKAARSPGEAVADFAREEVEGGAGEGRGGEEGEESEDADDLGLGDDGGFEEFSLRADSGGGVVRAASVEAEGVEGGIRELEEEDAFVGDGRGRRVGRLVPLELLVVGVEEDGRGLEE